MPPRTPAEQCFNSVDRLILKACWWNNVGDGAEGLNRVVGRVKVVQRLAG